jgi:hypothetical protein
MKNADLNEMAFTELIFSNGVNSSGKDVFSIIKDVRVDTVLMKVGSGLSLVNKERAFRKSRVY